MAELISIVKAAERSVERVRQPVWPDPMDHIKIDIIDGVPGPWLHLYAPSNKECNGRDPVTFLHFAVLPKCDLNQVCFVPYEGLLPDSDEYKARVASIEGCLKE
jgi:hypothetical protein